MNKIAPSALGISPFPKPKARSIDIPSITAAIETHNHDAQRAWTQWLSALIASLEGQLASDSAELVEDRIELLVEGHAPDEANRIAQLGSDHGWRGRVVTLLGIANVQLKRLQMASATKPPVQYKAEPFRASLERDKPAKSEAQRYHEQRQQEEHAAKVRRMSQNRQQNRPRVVRVPVSDATELARVLDELIAQGGWVISFAVLDQEAVIVYRQDLA